MNPREYLPVALATDSSPPNAPGRGEVPEWTGPLRHPSALVGGAGRCGAEESASFHPALFPRVWFPAPFQPLWACKIGLISPLKTVLTQTQLILTDFMVP